MTTAPTVYRDGACRRLQGRRYGELRGTTLMDPTGRPLMGGVVRPGDAHFSVEWAATKAQAGGSETRWLYLLPDDAGGTVVVECHPDEVCAIREGRMTIGEIRRYLGITTRERR